MKPPNEGLEVVRGWNEFELETVSVVVVSSAVVLELKLFNLLNISCNLQFFCMFSDELQHTWH